MSEVSANTRGLKKILICLGVANPVFAVAVLLLVGLGEGTLQLNIMSRYYLLVDRGYVSHNKLDQIAPPPYGGDWSAVPDYLTRDAFWVLELAAWVIAGFFVGNSIVVWYLLRRVPRERVGTGNQGEGESEQRQHREHVENHDEQP